MKQKKNTKLVLDQVAETQREILSVVDTRFNRLEEKVDAMFNMMADIHEAFAGEIGKSPRLLDQVHDLGVRVEKIEKQLAKRA